MKSPRRIVILQPAYIPWLGFFEQFAMADIFVFLDHVQYTRRSWYNRNFIMEPNGRKHLLTVPLHNAPQQTTIKDMRIFNEEGWSQKHLSSIRRCYAKAPYFNEIFGMMETALCKRHRFLSDLTIPLVMNIVRYLGYQTTIALSSDLNCKEKREHLMVEIASMFHADTLLTGALGKDLYDPVFFRERRITVEYQAYEHPRYTQQMQGFTPYLSVVDLLFNAGLSGREVIRTRNSYAATEMQTPISKGIKMLPWNISDLKPS
jgi:hypothetical protein